MINIISEKSKAFSQPVFSGLLVAMYNRADNKNNRLFPANLYKEAYSPENTESEEI